MVKTFKTIQLGKKITKKDLEKKGFKVSEWANDILEKIEFSKTKEKFDLVILSVSDLGFTGWTSYKNIITKAKEMGYELCPSETGALLRMDYTDQPANEWLYVAMEPISVAHDYPFVFYMARSDDGSWLRALRAEDDDGWYSHGRFVFVSRKSALNSEPLNSLKPSTLNPVFALKKSNEHYYTNIGDESLEIDVNTEVDYPYIKCKIFDERWRTPEATMKFLEQVMEIIKSNFTKDE